MLLIMYKSLDDKDQFNLVGMTDSVKEIMEVTGFDPLYRYPPPAHEQPPDTTGLIFHKLGFIHDCYNDICASAFLALHVILLIPH